MLDLLLLTVAVPLLGAGGIYLLSSLFSRLGIRRGYIRAVVALLAIGIIVLAGVVAFDTGDSGKVVVSSPYPPLLAESAAEMRWDTTLWPLGLSLSVVIGILLLDTAARGEQSSSLVVASCLLLAAGLAALWSANPFTTIVCWAFYDLTLIIVRIAASDKREDAVRSLAFGVGSGLLLWAGALAAGGGIGNVQWALMPPGGPKMTYWMLAGFLRLGVYPLHLLFPRGIRSPSPLIGALSLSPVLGWGLWIRLATVSDQGLPFRTWMMIPALLTLIAGSILAWTTKSPRESSPWIGAGVNGAVLLATVLLSLGGEGPVETGETVLSMMTLGTIGWMLSTAMLSLGGGLDLGRILRWEILPRSLPSFIGALSLIGIPATIGFTVESFLIRGLVEAGRWGWRLGFSVGHAFLVAAVIRWLIASNLVDQERAGLVGEIAHAVALTSVAVLLVVIGAAPNYVLPGVRSSSVVSLKTRLAAPGLAGWLLWGGGLVLGGTVAWLDMNLRPKISLWLNAIHDLVLFDWGYEVLVGAFERGLGLLRVVDNVLSGRGALLWSCVVFLVVVLMIGR